MRKYIGILVFAALLTCPTSSSIMAEEKAQFKRVGGTYKVTTIERRDDGSFLVIFESKKPTGKFDTLKLESDHVHFAVRKGQEIRLSAEILSVRGNEAEVSQVLLFLPHIQGATPVWLLSRKGRGRDLRGSRYLEMHAPQSDYTIL